MFGFKIKVLLLVLCALLTRNADGCCKHADDPSDQYDFPLKAIAMMKGEVTNPDTNTIQPITGSITFEQSVSFK
jgi:hypothetical protein